LLANSSGPCMSYHNLSLAPRDPADPASRRPALLQVTLADPAPPPARLLTGAESAADTWPWAEGTTALPPPTQGWSKFYAPLAVQEAPVLLAPLTARVAFREAQRLYFSRPAEETLTLTVECEGCAGVDVFAFVHAEPGVQLDSWFALAPWPGASWPVEFRDAQGRNVSVDNLRPAPAGSAFELLPNGFFVHFPANDTLVDADNKKTREVSVRLLARPPQEWAATPRALLVTLGADPCSVWSSLPCEAADPLASWAHLLPLNAQLAVAFGPSAVVALAPSPCGVDSQPPKTAPTPS